MKNFADYPETARLRCDIDWLIEGVYNSAMDHGSKDMHLYVYLRAKDFVSRGAEGESHDGMKWSTHPDYTQMRDWLESGLRIIDKQVKQLPDNAFKEEDTRRFHAMGNAIHAVRRSLEQFSLAEQAALHRT